jgi:hypothetical protein
MEGLNGGDQDGKWPSGCKRCAAVRDPAVGPWAGPGAYSAADGTPVARLAGRGGTKHLLFREGVMANSKGRNWKAERASVSVKGKARPRSNKYSKGDTTTRPAAGERERVWVGGYTRADGSKVSGYYRSNGNA